MTLSPARSIAWAAISFGVFAAGMFVMLVAIATVERISDAPHGLAMAAWALSWGVLSVVGVLVAGQLAFGAWLRPHPVGIAIAAVGIALATLLQLVLLQWEVARFGYPDPEYVGLTAGLFAMLIGTAVAAFGAFLVPRRLIGWLLAAVLLGFAGVAAVVASNLPGLANGIAPDSWPLAICVGLSGMYALVAASLVVRRAFNRSSEALET